MATSTPARALDRQGSAHAGSSDVVTRGVGVSGTLTLGSSLYNPTYAARPDNSGLALMRYAAHADVDLVGARLSIPIDLNLLSNRLAPRFEKLAPSEFDFIVGVTSTNRVGPGALEVGVRVERDAPVAHGNYTQTYVDARARYLYSFAHTFPGLASAMRGGDVRGWVTLGGFAFNPSYAARPDNTGLALLRYAVHAEASTAQGHLALGLDATMFTDRNVNAVRPSELDFTVNLMGHAEPFDFQIAYERDMPVDRHGLVQHFVYALASWSFSAHRAPPRAVEPTEPEGIESPPDVPIVEEPADARPQSERKNISKSARSSDVSTMAKRAT